MALPIDCSRPDSIAAADPDVDAAIRAAGDAWRRAFRAACAREGVHATVDGPPMAFTFAFDAQDTASAELIRDTFLGELRARGVVSGPTLYVQPGLDDDTIAAAARAIDDAVRRVRTLLVEFNSYLSGGVDWAFGDAPAAVRSRGLSVYRYPKLAPADVRFGPGRVDIAFAAGDLGEVTSSGFYVPTALRGDYSATVRYAIGTWAPGPEQACLALFTHDEASTVRFYAQRNASAAEPSVAQANVAGSLTGAVPCDAADGRFRIARRGATIVVEHAAGTDAFATLAEHACDTTPDMIVGAKMWTGGTTDGLAVRFEDLVLEGEPSPEQSPAPTARPDPRDDA